MSAADRGAVPAPSTTTCARATTARCCLPFRPATAGDGHRRPRDLAAVLPRRRHRLAGVHGTVNDVAMMGACRYIPIGRASSSKRLPARRPEAHRRVDGRGGARAGVPVVTGDTKVVEQGKGRRRVHHHHRRRRGARGPELGGAPCAAGRRGAALGHHRRPRRGGAAPARESLAFDTAIEIRHAPRCTAGGRHARCRPPRRMRCCATDTAAAWPPRSTRIAKQSGVGMMLDERRPFRSSRRSLPPASCSGWTRCTSPTRAN